MDYKKISAWMISFGLLLILGTLIGILIVISIKANIVFGFITLGMLLIMVGAIIYGANLDD